MKAVFRFLRNTLSLKKDSILFAKLKKERKKLFKNSQI